MSLISSISNTFRKIILGDGRVSLTTQSNRALVLGEGGNSRGFGANDLSQSRSNDANVASGTYGVIGGGQDNRASNCHTVVAGGYGNCATGLYSIVVGGFCNSAQSGASVVLGGMCNYNTGPCSSIVGGQCNCITSAFGIIGGGLCNIICSTHSTVMGGTCNRINADGCYSSILGGNGGFINSPGGLAWSASGTCGNFQKLEYLLKATTTDNTPKFLTFNGGAINSSTRTIIPSNRLYKINIYIVARSRTTGSASFARSVLIENNAGASSVVGGIQTIFPDQGSNAGNPPDGWAVDISVDDTNDNILISVTGEVSNTIDWMAHLDGIQVGV